MKKLISFAMLVWEFMVIFGITGLFAFAKMTALSTGSVLTFIGAFLPSRFIDRLTGGAIIRLKNVEISLSGSLRMGVISCGIITIILSLLFGIKDLGDKVDEVNKELRVQIQAHRSSSKSSLRAPGEAGAIQPVERERPYVR